MNCNVDYIFEDFDVDRYLLASSCIMHLSKCEKAQGGSSNNGGHSAYILAIAAETDCCTSFTYSASSVSICGTTYRKVSEQSFKKT